MPKNTLPKIYAGLASKRFISISKAAKILQVSPDTLRNWEKQGKLIPSRTPGGARRYNSWELLALKKELDLSKPVQRGLLSVSQAAHELRISKDTLRNWTKKGLIDSQRTKGGARRFTRSEIKRVQSELGIELATNIQPQIHKFSPPWLKIFSSGTIITLIVIIALLMKMNLDAQEQKVQQALGLINKLAATVESLQGGVYGIQTELIPTPTSPPPQTTYIYQPQPSGLSIKSAQSPLIINNGELGCKDCLTISSTYIADIKNEDGALGIKTDQKALTISLEMGHSNNWSANQYFNSGLTINNGFSEGGSLYGMTSSVDLSSGFQKAFAGLFNAQGQAGGSNLTYAIGLQAQASGAEYNFAAVFPTGNVGIGTTTPVEGKLVIVDDGLSSLPVVHIDSQQTISSADIFTIESDTANGSGADTVKFKITADGSVYSDAGIYSGQADLAEMYFVQEGVEEADLVELISSDIENISYMVQKASRDSGNRMLGVVSTKPGAVLGYDLSRMDLIVRQKPVALAGRVLIKVSAENGPIEIGDYLTSSSIPGVAMKATQAGEVLGKALESFEGATSEVCQESTQLTSEVKCGKILVFVRVGYADPNNFLASLSLDDQGNLLMPKIKVDQLVMNDEIDLSSKIASLEERMSELEEKLDVGNEKLDNEVGSESQNISPQDLTSHISPLTSTQSAELTDVSQLDLTPPDILLATDSAKLANIDITSDANILGALTAYEAEIADNFKVLGKSTLADTLVAGELVVDGSLSLTTNSINAMGTLYLQNSPLAEQLDLFNGLVTVDKNGHLRAEMVTVAQFRVVANKISGSGKILAGQTFLDVENPLVEPTSRILITPTSNTNLVLAVTEKEKGKRFRVSSPKEAENDIDFDWLMINETEDKR
ncbi:MerR family DNA-binding transcriptional regulator [Candidatus Daviesbacteria bacterium]|nr:MerR family DNA-binding transcriptional regulator [Candidatus Daviesbacteria bacterium]